MSKNVWLARAEAKKSLPKFKGKFQEAARINCQGRMYPRHVMEEVVDDRPVASMSADGLAERWHPPSDDECGWFPMRPKEEPQLKLMEDAMVVYHLVRSPEDKKITTADIKACRQMEADGESAAEWKEMSRVDVEYFRSKLMKALQMPSSFLAQDLDAAIKNKAVSGEFIKHEDAVKLLNKIKMKRIEDLKLEVMANNPVILGAPISFDPAQIIHCQVANANGDVFVAKPESFTTEGAFTTHENNGSWCGATSCGVVPNISDVFDRPLVEVANAGDMVMTITSGSVASYLPALTIS